MEQKPTYTISHKALMIGMDELNKTLDEIEPPKINVEVKKSEEDVKNGIIELYNKVVDFSKLWTIKNINIENLIVHSEAEYACLNEYRNCAKLNDQTLCKSVCDDIITRQQSIFSDRNRSKAPTTKKNMLQKMHIKK